MCGQEDSGRGIHEQDTHSSIRTGDEAFLKKYTGEVIYTSGIFFWGGR